MSRVATSKHASFSGNPLAVFGHRDKFIFMSENGQQFLGDRLGCGLTDLTSLPLS
jgi:hypothetical protein